MAVEMGIRRTATTMQRNAMEPVTPRMTSSLRLCPLKGFPRPDRIRSTATPRPKRNMVMSQTLNEGPSILISPVSPVYINADPNIRAGPAMDFRIDIILFSIDKRWEVGAAI